MKPVYTTLKTQGSRKGAPAAEVSGPAPKPSARMSSWPGNPRRIGVSSPVAVNTGTASSRAGTRMPQGLVNTSTSRITQASMPSVTALATVRGRPGSLSTLPAGIPIWLPASQAVLSAR